MFPAFLLWIWPAQPDISIGPCGCPANSQNAEEPHTSWVFAGGKEIVLCGEQEEENGEVYFSQFVLAECGADSVLLEYDAAETCRIFFLEDHLYIENLMHLPVGKNRFHAVIPWMTDVISIERNQPVVTHELNRGMNVYTRDQVRTTIREFYEASPEANDSTENLISRLFVASLSGDAEARACFELAFSKFNLDGGYAEIYADYRAILSIWENQ